MIFAKECVDAGQPRGGDGQSGGGGQSAQAGVDFPSLTIDSAEVSFDRSICVSYIYLFLCNNVYVI